MQQVVGRLPKYTCSAAIERKYFKAPRVIGRTCDDVIASRNTGLIKSTETATDRLRFDVEIADAGFEIFSWPGSQRFDANKLLEIGDGGPIGTGPFGAFLGDIFTNAGATFKFEREKTVNGRRLLEYRFRVPLESSHYKAGMRGMYRFIAYDGQFRLDPASANLVSLEVRTAELPRETESCEATTKIDFQNLRIGYSEFLAPLRSVLGVIGKYGDDSESVTSYSACHEFHGEAEVHFDDTPSASDSVAAAVPGERAEPLPAGLPVALIFETPIDTNVAAAGDPLTAQVVEAVVEPGSKRMLVPAGTKITGRVVHMEHHLAGGNYFLLSVQFDTLHLLLDRAFQTAGDSKRGQAPCWDIRNQIESKGRLSNGFTFVLPSKGGHYVMPAGCESRWVTAPAAQR